MLPRESLDPMAVGRMKSIDNGKCIFSIDTKMEKELED